MSRGSARRRLTAVIRCVVVLVPVAALSQTVVPAAAAADSTLFAYAAGGAAAPTSCPQTATTSARCSLAQALALATAGDTVLLAEPGPFVGQFVIGTAGTSAGSPITVTAAPGVSRPVLDGGQRGTVVSVAAGVHAVLSGLTVRDGRAPERDDPPCIQATVALGGGIYNHGDLSIEGVTLTANVADDPTGHALVGIGGGIYNAGALTVTDSTFDGNTATRSGGAISNGDDRSGCGTATTSTTATVTDSRFTNNAADFGGAISSGGAGGDGALTVSRSTFTGNGRTTALSGFSGTAGGAVATARGGDGSAVVTDSTFNANTADRGAAISSSETSSAGQLSVRNSTFVANVATSGAESIDQGATSVPASVTSSTFRDDSISGSGALVLAASILVRSPCRTPVTDGGYNVSDDATCPLSAAQHSLASTPMAAYLGKLGPHGGPTDTVPLSSAPDDPANDVIPGTFAPGGVAVCAGADQRGVRRSTPCDMGAVESPVAGAGLFAYPTGTGGADGTCPLTTVAAQRCTLTTALGLAEAGSTIELAQSGDPTDRSTWYVGTYVVDVAHTTPDRPLTIEAASGVTNPIVDGNLGSNTGCGTARCDAQIFAVSSDNYVDFQGFTIQHGSAELQRFGSTFGGSALAVNFAHVTATSMRFVDNIGHVISAAFDTSGQAGGGFVTLVGSTMDSVATTSASIAADGGTVVITRSTIGRPVLAGQLVMTDSTAELGVTADTATITDSTVSQGGFAGLSAVSATVTGSTFVDNPGGAFNVINLTMAATIMVRAAGGAPNCSTPATLDAGYNVSDDASCGLTGSGSVQDSTAISSYLGELGDHGGPTPTIPLLATPTSAGAGPDPAARAIPASFTAPGESAPHCSLADQRGVARTPLCDIGAYELGGTAPTITSANHVTFTSGVGGSFTITTTGTPTPAITFSGTLPAGVELVDNGDGSATVSGRTSDGGSYPLTITADNRTLPAATQVFTLTVARAPQLITVTSAAPAHPVIGDTYQVAATGGGSGQPIAYSIDPASDPNACTVDTAGLVTFTGAGTCVIDVDQSGSADYLPADQVQQTVTVGRAAQTIVVTSTPPAAPTVGDSYQIEATGGGSDNPLRYAVDPTATTGACTVDSTGVVVFAAPGECVIDIDQAGTADYDPGHLIVRLSVGAGPTATPGPTSTPTAGAHVAQAAASIGGLAFTGAAAVPVLGLGAALSAAGLVLLVAFRGSRPGHRQ